MSTSDPKLIQLQLSHSMNTDYVAVRQDHAWFSACVMAWMSMLQGGKTLVKPDDQLQLSEAVR